MNGSKNGFNKKIITPMAKTSFGLKNCDSKNE
jgi:hypothetical protein